MKSIPNGNPETNGDHFVTRVLKPEEAKTDRCLAGQDDVFTLALMAALEFRPDLVPLFDEVLSICGGHSRAPVSPGQPPETRS